MSTRNPGAKKGYKKKIQNPLTLTASYKHYIKDIKKTSKYYLTEKEYREILYAFNKEAMRAIIEDGYFFKLPFRLGTIRIRKRQTNLNNLQPDFYHFNNKDKEDSAISHLNEHSGGYYGRFYWNKRKAVIVKNRTLYSFIPSRANKRYLAKTIKSDPFQIDKYFE